ncbi:MAG TPA: invasion associated locus B family protein [Rhizomicrobium sp.]|jgi:invasion protein IalB
MRLVHPLLVPVLMFASAVLAAPQHAPAKPPQIWQARCSSPARALPVDCSLEQRVVIRTSGQLLASVTINVPHDTRKPGILIQVPFGLALKSGVTLSLDNHGPARLDVQTCDQNGCYAGTMLSGDFLAAMLTGKMLTVKMQAMNGQNIAVPMPLTGFKDAYNSIR